MSRRLFNALSLISAVYLLGTVNLWIWSFWADARTQSLSFANDFHVAAERGRLSFFNDKDYGPYRGSIIAIVSEEWPMERIFSKHQAFGETLGIYYRYFRWADSGAVLWTLSISLIYPLILFSLLPAIWIVLRRQQIGERLMVIGQALRDSDDPRREIRLVIRLYWWMGVLGLTIYAGAVCIIGLRLMLRLEPVSLNSVGPLVFCGMLVALFGASLHVAQRLATRPDGMLAYARIIGIALAVAYFPVLTLPGIICVERVTKHLAAYCESLGADSGA